MGVFRSIEMMLLPFLFLLCLILPAMGEKVQQVNTHTSSCFSCGMIEGTSYLTVKICGGSDCCLSRSLDNDDINWIPGQTDRFHGPESLLECADFEVGAGPFYLTAFHDGPDGLTLDWIAHMSSALFAGKEILYILSEKASESIVIIVLHMSR